MDEDNNILSRWARMESGTKNRVFAGIAIVCALLAMGASVFSGFTNYDDPHLLLENPLVRDLSPSGIKAMFTSWLNPHYKPLVFLSWAIEYALFGFNPFVYHLNNVLLHALNAALIFVFFERLTKNKFVGFWIAVFFAVHPLHVESVAWVSERKDVLYTAFFFASLIKYLDYTKTLKRASLIFSLVFFLLALGSKMMAISLPFILWAVDYYQGRKFSVKLITEKIPFLVVLLLPILFIDRMQQLLLNVDDPYAVFGLSFTFLERILIANYEFLFYIYKTFLPINLAALYPYPNAVEEGLPQHFMLLPIITIAILAVTIWTARKNRASVFGLLFFFLTIFPALQLLIPISGTIAADRYTYVASSGIIFILLAGILEPLSSKSIALKKYRNLALTPFALLFLVLAIIRTDVWSSDVKLWTDVIEKYPGVWLSYNNRGTALGREQKTQEALRDFDAAIQLNQNYAEAYLNRALIYKNQKNYTNALADLSEAVRIDSTYVPAFNNRAWIYYRVGDYDRALQDYDKAVFFTNERDASMLMNRANVLLAQGLNLFAMSEYDKALALDGGLVEAYINQAEAYFRYGHQQGQTETYTPQALENYAKAKELAPNNINVLFNEGLLFYKLRKYEEALADMRRVLEINPDHMRTHYTLATIYVGMKDYNAAMESALVAKRLGHTDADVLIELIQAEIEQQEKEI